nr:ribonuclease H-like domain-containing protein [Tanacetum cinerariifolium]
MRFLNKEIKPANYAKISHLSGVFVPQTTKSKEELFLSNMVTVSKTISIPNEDLSDNTTPSVARKFLNEADESLDKQKSLELEIERLLKASVSHDIVSIVQNGFVNVPYDLQTELDPYNDMQQKVERWQAQLRDLKGKSSDTASASNTLDLLNQKLEAKIVELEFQVVNYERTSVTPHVDKPKLIAITPHSKKLHASIPSHFVPQPREFNVVKHRNVIAPGMFNIDPSQTFRVDPVPNNQSSESIRTNPITNFQRHVTFKENVSSDTVNASSTGLVHTARTRRPQPKGNSRNARVPSASMSSEVKKNVTVEDHRRILLLSKNQKTMSSECNNIKLAIRNDKSKIICGTCKQCLVTTNHDACLLSPVNALNSRANNLCANASLSANQKRHRTQVWKPKQVGFEERLACNRFTNLYTINLYDMGSASPICLMARATPTKSWLWRQRLSHLNFDTINDLDKNDLVSNLPKFKYAKEHLCPFCEQEKSKRASHPSKPVLNSKQRLHLLHMDLTKDETPENDREDIGKLGAKGDIGFFIGYSANSVAYKVYNRRTKKVMETVNVTFDKLSAMAFEQNSSKPGLQSLTSRQISSELELTYAPSTITP